ncbi:hypothetical protein C9424_17790, partial [Arthrobacter sp. H-02-3]
MNALWITLALLTAGFIGWPVTAMVFRLARTIDDRADSAGVARAGGGRPGGGGPPPPPPPGGGGGPPPRGDAPR